MHHSVSAPGVTQAHPFSSERHRPLPPPPFQSVPAPNSSPPCPSSPNKVSFLSSLATVPDHIPSELLLEDEDQRRENVPSFRTPEYSIVGELGPAEGYQRLDHGVRVERKSLSPPRVPSEGYSRLKHSHQSAPALPPQNASRSRSASHSPPPAVPPDRHGPTASEGYSRLSHGAVGQYSKLDRSGKEVLPGGEEYGKLDLAATGEALQPREDYDQLGTPSPVLRKKSPPIPAPYKPRPGSPMPGLIRELNAVHTSESGGNELASTMAPGHHGYDEVAGDVYDDALNTAVVDRHGYENLSNTAVVPMYDEASNTTEPGRHSEDKYDDVVSITVSGAEGGEVYSEVGPSAPRHKVSEGYERLNHSAGSTAPTGGAPGTAHAGGVPGTADNNSTPLPTTSRQLSVKYRRVGPSPRPQSVIDPYASLSDANISDISAALRQETPADEGGYSQLQLVGPCGRSHVVDETGYSKPWTSFTASAGAKVNHTPKPSLNGPAPLQNGLQARSAIRHHPNQNGTEAGPTADQSEFEALYDKVGDKDESNPPVPPPRGAGQHSHSPPAPRRWSKRAKKPLPSS